MGSWTFVTNYGAVLSVIAQRQRVTAREIALELDITERTVHRIISGLEAAGYLRRFKRGAVNSYSVNDTLPLRRPEIQDVAVARLLEVLGPRPPRKPRAI